MVVAESFLRIWANHKDLPRVDGGYLESSQNADENIQVQVNSAAT